MRLLSIAAGATAAASMLTVAGSAVAAAEAAPKLTRVVPVPVTADRVALGVEVKHAADDTAVKAYDRGRLVGTGEVAKGKAVVPIQHTLRAESAPRSIAVVVGDHRRTVTIDLDTDDLKRSPWFVVNKRHGAARYVPKKLKEFEGGRLEVRALDAYRPMAKAADKDGSGFWVASSYRSAERQKQVYEGYVARDGAEKADTYSARPGHSEHQTGLVIDIANGVCNLERCFAETAAGRWASKHAAEHGFVVRYTRGSDEVTGYRYEPWHLRYVGRWLATYLQDSDTATLEEAFDLDDAADYPRPVA